MQDLHVFADKAYGAVAYFSQGFYTSLVMSKTRVAPLKTLSLPRLELIAASSVKCQCNVHLWSDGQIVLYWIKNHKKFKPFVNARISEITSNFPATNWHYCPTSDNPADLLQEVLLLNNLPYLPADGNVDQHSLPPRHCGLRRILQMLSHHNPEMLPVH